MKSRTLLTTLLLTCLLPLAASAASGKNTAAYYKAHLDKYLNKNISLEVPFVRALPEGPEAQLGLSIFVAPTIDMDNHAEGGHILVVTDESEAKKLVRKFGTNLERKGKSIETNKLRGVLRVLDAKFNEKERRDIIFLDKTQNGLTNEKLEKLIKRMVEANQGAQGGGRKR